MFHAAKFIAIQVSVGGDMESLFSRCRQIHPHIAGVVSEYSSSPILTPYSSLNHSICGNQPPTLNTVFIFIIIHNRLKDPCTIIHRFSQSKKSALYTVYISLREKGVGGGAEEERKIKWYEGERKVLGGI